MATIQEIKDMFGGSMTWGDLHILLRVLEIPPESSDVFGQGVLFGVIQKRTQCSCGTTMYYSAEFDEHHPFLYTKTGRPCSDCYDDIVRKNARFIKSS